MSTKAYPVLRQLAADWEKKCGLPTAVISGIVGDTSHAARGGYHISRDDQVSKTNYSVVRPDDRAGKGPDDAASAIDMTMSTADMKLCTARLVRVFSDKTDPRGKYINAFNGWSGSGDAKRYDFYSRVVSKATPDHKWHIHLSIRRAYANSATAAKAILSALRGDSKATYLASIAPKPAASSSAYPGRVLRRNDRQAAADPAVKVWQARALESGWAAIGKADGFFGPGTETVVKAIQRQNDLTVDGEIGPATWAITFKLPKA